MAMATCKLCRSTKYRVLVVDDHPLVRHMLAKRIAAADRLLDVHSLCDVATGEESVIQAKVFMPHVVLMDIRLPGINGFEAAKRIKQETPSAQIVMVTGSEEPEYREEAAKLGAAGFVTKDKVRSDLVSLLL